MTKPTFSSLSLSLWLFFNESLCINGFVLIPLSQAACRKTGEAPGAAVCLQPPSVDLWLQVPIMAANFKGLVGYVPTTACRCPCGA